MKQLINIINYLLLFVIGIIIYYLLNRKDSFEGGNNIGHSVFGHYRFLFVDELNYHF